MKLIIHPKKQIDSSMLLYKAFARNIRIALPDDCGIITAVDSRMFVAFQLLYTSFIYSHEGWMTLVNLGLTDRELEWCSKQHNLIIINNSQEFPFKNRKNWQTWNKPFYIEMSPFKKTLWIDSDCIIGGDLNEVFDLLKDSHPLFTPDDPNYTSCSRELFSYLKMKIEYERHPFLNAGVMAFDFNESLDRRILNEWKDLIISISKYEKLENLCIFHDQSALKCIIEKHNIHNLIIKDRSVNFLCKIHRYMDLYNFLSYVRNFQGTIKHFCGTNFGPKPWHSWKNMNIEIFGLNYTNLKTIEKDTFSEKVKMFVVHSDQKLLDLIPDRPYLEKFNLNDLSRRNELCENRMYLSGIIDRCDHEYVGMGSAKWNYKYKSKIENIYLIEKDLAPNRVFVADKCDENWAEYSEEFHPGIMKYLIELSNLCGLPLVAGESFWANNFICHHDVFMDFMIHWRKCFEYFEKREMNFKVLSPCDKKLKLSYFLERATIIYFANREDLEIVEI